MSQPRSAQRHFLFWFAWLALAAIYVWNRSSHLTFGDSAGLFMWVDRGFTLRTTAGSHFLYVNFLHALLLPFPWEWRMEVAFFHSIAWSLATAALLYFSVKKLTGNALAGVLTMVVFGLSFTNWRQSEIIEVYTLNNFICLGYISLILLDLKENSARRATWVAVIYGISWYSHIGNTLLGPLMAWYGWHIFQLGGWKPLVRTAALSLLVVSGLFVLPLLLGTHPLREIFTSGGFQDEIMASGISLFAFGFLESIAYYIYNFGLFAILPIQGLFLLFKGNKKIFWACVLAAFPTWVFAMRFQVSDNYVFFLPAYLALMLASGFGAVYWVEKIKISAIALIGFSLIIFPLQYYSALQVAKKVPQTEAFAHRKAYKGGLDYYLWPGMRNNVNILDKGREIYYGGKPYPYWMEDMAWNYASTMQYLDYIGEVDLKKLDTLQEDDVETKPLFRKD